MADAVLEELLTSSEVQTAFVTHWWRCPRRSAC